MPSLPFRIPFCLIVLFFMAGSPGGIAQDRPKSPVFKDYDNENSPRIFRRSTATYRMWKLFVVIRSANAGDPLAQHELGVRYLAGEGVTPDTVKAAYWVGLAAKKGVIPARYNLGILTYYGWGVPWNPFEAYRHFLYCARQEMREAQYVLGQFLTDNLVVQRDYAEARRWLERAVQAEFEPARKMLEQMDEEIPVSDSGSVVPGDSSEIALSDSLYGPIFIDFTQDTTSPGAATEWLADLLESGDHRLRYAFGEQRFSTDKTDSVALPEILASANAGSPEALVLLGKLYEKGIGVPSDEVRAAVHYLRAVRLGSPQAYELLFGKVRKPGFINRIKSRANLGDSSAKYAWAILYYLGLDLLTGNVQERLTDDQAFRFLHEAASEKHFPSMIETGLCYFAGRWVGMNRDRAISLWKEAEEIHSRTIGNSVSEGAIRIAMATVRGPAEYEDLREALLDLKDGARVGSLLSEVAIAYCFENGIGVAPDKGSAARLYRLGAYRGSQDAYYALRRMHDEVRPDDEEFRVDH